MEYFDMRKMSVNLWRNAAGETREICTFPPAKRDFYWRASIASIAANGEFSLFPGMEVKAKLTAGQMSMDFNIMTRLDVCKAKVRIAERTFTTFGSRGGVVFVINGAWQLGDKLLTTDQGACWFDGRHTLRLLQPQGKLLFSEINWLAGHSPDQVQ